MKKEDIIKKGEKAFWDYNGRKMDGIPDKDTMKAMAEYMKKEGMHDYYRETISDEDIDWLYSGEFVPCIEVVCKYKTKLLRNITTDTHTYILPYLGDPKVDMEEIIWAIRGYEYPGYDRQHTELVSVDAKINYYYDRELWYGWFYTNYEGVLSDEVVRATRKMVPAPTSGCAIEPDKKPDNKKYNYAKCFEIGEITGRPDTW